MQPAAVEPLALHLGLVATAVLAGQLLLWGLQAVERAVDRAGDTA